MNLTIICNVDVKSKSKGLECNNAFHDAFHTKKTMLACNFIFGQYDYSCRKQCPITSYYRHFLWYGNCLNINLLFLFVFIKLGTNQLAIHFSVR